MEQKSKIIWFPKPEIYNLVLGNTVRIPLFTAPLWAGEPTDVPDGGEEFAEIIEVPKEFVRNPKKTYGFRVKGDSMYPLIKDGDQIIVDRSEQEKSKSRGRVIVAYLDGDYTVKRLMIKKNKLYLVPENPEYRDIEIKAGMNFIVWGLVIGVNEIRRIE
jgi:DNA polymerase V